MRWALLSGVVLLLVVPAAQARRPVCDRVAAPHARLATPGALVAALRPGQVGCLRGAEYRQRQVVIRKPGITIRSSPGERASWAGRVVLAANRVTLRGLNLDGSLGPPCLGRGCYPHEDTLPSPTVNGPDSRVIGNDITNPTGICINVRGFYGLHPDGFLIARNRIHDCRPATNHIHGIYLSGGGHGRVRDNAIFDNGDKGIVFFPAAHDTLVTGNTIVQNRTSVHFGGDRRQAPNGNVLRHNVIAFPAPHDGRPARFNVESHFAGPVGRRNVLAGNCLYTTAADSFFAGDPPASGIAADREGFTADTGVVADPLLLDRANS